MENSVDQDEAANEPVTLSWSMQFDLSATFIVDQSSR